MVRRNRKRKGIAGQTKSALRALLRRFDIDIHRHSSSLGAIRARLLRAGVVDLVLDVGASGGQYARAIRALGYKGRIASFEPLREPFSRLASLAHYDDSWTSLNMALGGRDGYAEMFVARNWVSSSLLQMLEAHRSAAPDSYYVGTESVVLRRLDSIRSDVIRSDDRVWFKIDTQGYELEILRGAEQALTQAIGVEIELSLFPLYEGQGSVGEILLSLYERDFVIVGLEQGLTHPKSRFVLQIDAILLRQTEARAFLGT